MTEVFNKDNPFIAPSPEDIEYYGLDFHKKEVKPVVIEPDDEEDDDDYED